MMLLVMSGSTDPVFSFKTGVVQYLTVLIVQPLHQTGLLTELQEEEVCGTKEEGGVVDIQIFAICCVKCTKSKFSPVT